MVIKITKIEKRCFTLGFSAMEVEQFIGILKKYKIECIVDVRSVPYSKFADQFNRNNIEKRLKENGIYYSNFAKEFGARRNSNKLYNNKEILDFELVIKTEEFQKGVKRIKQGIKNYNIAIVCSEKDPLECHRFSMVSRGLSEKSINVEHIIIDGKVLDGEEVSTEIKTHKEIEIEIRKKEMKKKKYDRNQRQIGDILKTKEEIEKETELMEASFLRTAYKELNKKIGHKKEKEKDEEEGG